MAHRLSDLYTLPLTSAPAWITGGMLMKGGVMLCAGPAKQGKSYLMLDAADSLSRGGGSLWGTGFEIPEPVPTLYLDGELGLYGLHERTCGRYNHVGCPPPEGLYYVTKPKGMMLDTLAGTELLAREIKATGARVVIVDPISRFIIGDENSNTEVNKLFANLNGLVSDYNDLSFILSHHYGKAPRGENAEGYDPLDPYNARGAAKFFDAVDALVTFQRLPGALPGEWWRIKTGWKPRHAPEPEPITLALHDGGVVTRVDGVSGGLPAGKARMFGRR